MHIKSAIILRSCTIHDYFELFIVKNFNQVHSKMINRVRFINV